MQLRHSALQHFAACLLFSLIAFLLIETNGKTNKFVKWRRSQTFPSNSSISIDSRWNQVNFSNLLHCDLHINWLLIFLYFSLKSSQVGHFQFFLCTKLYRKLRIWRPWRSLSSKMQTHPHVSWPQNNFFSTYAETYELFCVSSCTRWRPGPLLRHLRFNCTADNLQFYCKVFYLMTKRDLN